MSSPPIDTLKTYLQPMAKIVERYDSLSQKQQTAFMSRLGRPSVLKQSFKITEGREAPGTKPKLQDAMDAQAKSIKSAILKLSEKANDLQEIRLMSMLSEYVNGMHLRYDSSSADEVHGRLELCQQLLEIPAPPLPPTGGNTAQDRRCLMRYQEASKGLEKCRQKMGDGLMDLCEMAQSGLVDAKQTLATCATVCQESLIHCLRVIYLLRVHERLLTSHLKKKHKTNDACTKSHSAPRRSVEQLPELRPILSPKQRGAERRDCLPGQESVEGIDIVSQREDWITQRDQASRQQAASQNKRRALEVELTMDPGCKRRRSLLQEAVARVMLVDPNAEGRKAPSEPGAQTVMTTESALLNDCLIARLLEQNRNLELLLCERELELHASKHQQACRQLRLLDQPR